MCALILIKLRLETRKKTRTEKPAVQDEKLLELQRRLEEKRAERINAQQKSQLKPDKKSAQRLQQLSSAKVCERQNWQIFKVGSSLVWACQCAMFF